MPESAQEWYDRVAARIAAEGHRHLGWGEWETWPIEGELVAQRLQPPTEERPRGGAGGVDCFMCDAAAGTGGDYLVWTDDLFMVGVPQEEIAIPFTAFLMPTRHADLSDLAPEESRRLGELLVAAEQAVVAVLDVPRMQVSRYGDGQEHLHWWLLGRPTGMGQLRGTFLPHWDELLPARTRAELRADLVLVAEQLVSVAGGRVLP